jgi:hypothetical protein
LFKPYAQLKTRLDKVLGFEGIAPSSTAESIDLSPPAAKFAPRSAPVDIGGDDDLEYFKSLAEE